MCLQVSNTYARRWQITARANARAKRLPFGKRNAMKTIKKIADVACEFELDEHGFINVFIAEGQALFPQGVVRGAVRKNQA